MKSSSEWDGPSVMSASVNEVGITAPGSISEQKFSTASWFPTETETHVLVLRLLGDVGGHKVVRPVTVSEKKQCVSCSKMNKATASFCSRCGTGLNVIA